ncbi:MAG: hypothetical protein HQ561_09185 [Desulfobacteraceae bacterium]|nr:hypothetical protein [Desulfobacteraceae bacterium]
MNPGKEKTLIILICVFGILAVGYGMVTENHPVFVVGILLVIGGYLLIRRRIKASAGKNSGSL